MYGQLQSDYYIARGAGREQWAPQFSYKGFRYVQVSGPGGGPLSADAVVALERVHQVHSDLARVSAFHSVHGTLDRIHRNTIWAVRSNLHGLVTDTPVYEKNAWTGDAQLMAGSTSLLFDTSTPPLTAPRPEPGRSAPPARTRATAPRGRDRRSRGTAR